MPCKRGDMPQVLQEGAFQISMQEQEFHVEDEIAFLDVVTSKGKRTAMDCQPLSQN